MNKNWNDRADKDLFFTILQVKQIGVISGSEWTTIGNTMRTMGYGFTNEGCRQHFQGLRRAQSKSDSTPKASPVAASRDDSKDPTLNPITRRPGPGRGRPRKNAKKDGSSANGPGSSPDTPAPNAGMPNVHVHPNYNAPNAPMMAGPPDASGLPTNQVENQPPPSAHRPLAPNAPQNDDDLAMDPSLMESDEQAAKRRRLDDSHDLALDTEEAVLSTLAAHNNSSRDGVESYPAEFNYGEA